MHTLKEYNIQQGDWMHIYDYHNRISLTLPPPHKIVIVLCVWGHLRFTLIATLKYVTVLLTIAINYSIKPQNIFISGSG